MKIRILDQKKQGLIYLITGIVLSLLFYFLFDAFFRIAVFLISLFLIFLMIINLNTLFMMKDRKSRVSLVFQTVLILGAIIILLMPIAEQIIGIVCGSIILINLITILINSDNKIESIKRNLFLYILSIMLIFMGVSKVGQYFAIGCSLLLSLYGLYLIIFGKKVDIDIPNFNANNNAPLNDNVVDVSFEEETND